MKERSFKKYIILWLSQSVSGLGSSMTGFALVLLLLFITIPEQAQDKTHSSPPLPE